MNGLERFRGVMAHGEIDRVPVIPILHTAAAELAGLTIGEYAANPSAMAATMRAAHEAYGLDGVQLSLGVATEASGMGCGIVYPPDGLPKTVHPVIVEPADLAKVGVPDPNRDGLMPLFLRGLELTAEALGDAACVMAVIRGPLNIASQIRGIQALMYDFIDRPGFAQEVLALSNRAALALGQAAARAGAHVVVIGEALASPAFISPAYYRERIAPWHAELVRGLAETTQVHSLMHICGDIRPILPDIVATGVDIVDIDWQVPVDEARRLGGADTVFRGNIDPVAALHDGDPAMVGELSRVALEQASHRGWLQAGGGFILSSGCDIPPGTPPANIAAMVAAARDA